MYVLYIGNKNYSSWSLRPWLLLRALAIPFEERLVPFAEGSSWAEFRRFSPTGRVPCLHDGASIVWDSLAIVEYLAERHSGVWPEDSAARAWTRSAVCEIHSGFAALRERCSMNCGVRVELGEIGKPLQADLARLEELWHEGRSRFGGPFLAGRRLGAVDAFYAPVAFRAQTYTLPLGRAAKEYVQLLLDQQPMREWYAAALAEPWRDQSHEAELASAGALRADYRTSQARA